MAGDLSGVADSAPIEAVLVEEPARLRPVMPREVSMLALWTLAADLLIFRTLGFTGPALFLAMAPLLLIGGCPAIVRKREATIIVGLIMLVAARLIWLGTGLTVVSGIVLVVALSMAVAGSIPLVVEGFVFAARVIGDGAARLTCYRLPRRPDGRKLVGVSTPSWLFPTVAAIVFGAIFVFANPDLLQWVSTRVTRWFDLTWSWLAGISFWEIPFCIVALLVGAGLLRPALPMFRFGPNEADHAVPTAHVASSLYPAFRNTLLTLIVLFAAYLVFEFATLWRREFPDGFYYAGYAHEGAAWLTFALALATGVLSIAFSGKMLSDDRVIRLRRLAWIWSAQNLLLAAAVYNRLLIYVDYNGMTRLRTVAFFGTTAVVIGFILVLYKIGRQRGFWWLIRAQLVALMLTVITYSLFPVDYIAHRYNSMRVSSGYLHPSVMIAVKPTTDEGVFPLLKLVACEDEIIREGVLATLAQRQHEIETSTAAQHWTEYQASRGSLLRRLKSNQSAWEMYSRSGPARQNALDRFRDYAMQWY